MAEEQQAQGQTKDPWADFGGNAMGATAEEWDKAGLEDEGPVGLKIVKAEKGIRQTSDGTRSWPVVELEFDIIARPGQKLEQTGKFWESMSLEPRFIRRFKNFVGAIGVKHKGEGKLLYAEVIKALPGRTVFGVIKHGSFKDKKTNEKVPVANLGNRFGKSFEDLTA